MGNAVCWFSITGKDVAALTAFYKKSFGWKTAPGPDGMVFVTKEPDGIPGGISTQPGPAFYVQVQNVDKAAAKVTAAGARATSPKMVLPNGMGAIATFTDPEGNDVGLYQPPKAAPAPAPKKAAKKAPKKAAAKKAAAPKAKKAAPKPGKKGRKKARRG